MKRIDILGAGPAGLAAAHFAKKNNIPFQLYESESKIGGNCKTFEFDGCKYDTGAHRFHNKNNIATQAVKDLIGDDLISVVAPSKIYWQEKMINFPLDPVSIIKNFKTSTIFKIIIENLLNIFKRSLSINSFRDSAYRKYGKTISEIFLISYTEKLWGTSSDLLDHKVSGDRLKNLNLLSVFKSLINPSKQNTKHYEGEFLYPKYGYGQIFEVIGNKIKDHIFCDSAIEKIYHKNGLIKELVLSGNKKIKTDNILSTLPIDYFSKCLDPLPPNEIIDYAKSLSFRNLRLAIFTLGINRFSKNASIYFPEKNLPFTRIYEPKNRSIHMAPKNKTCIVVEVPYDKDDIYHTAREDNFLDQIKSLLIKHNIINKSYFINSTSLIMPNAYPVLTTSSQKKLEKINAYFDTFNNLKFIGRNAQFKYLHTHHLFKIAHNTINKFKNNKK